jgi:hypothetical protein
LAVEAKTATRLRVPRAVLELSEEKLTIEIALDEVASRAGTSVETVLRHFGSRDGLLDEAVNLASTEVARSIRGPWSGQLLTVVHVTRTVAIGT